jgi:hypothetical protein
MDQKRLVPTNAIKDVTPSNAFIDLNNTPHQDVC